ncbi:hypothetical protein QZH41_011361 [Actinostola sp. cb2023]|nr:hypothetical protein QZH41_011361 [Actinostola sp. cb2023]
MEDPSFQVLIVDLRPTSPPLPSSNPSGIIVGIIVAAVLVPTIVMVIGIVGVLQWRKRKLRWRIFDFKEDDRNELVLY